MSNPISKEMFAEFSKHFSEYKAPDNSRWVSLTDEEMLTLEETTTCTKDESWLRNLTRAIEAKLKEKNNG
jgi:hypothetical protein